MKQLQQLESSTSESNALKQAAIKKLSKERDDLLELTKSRDRVIQVSSSNNKNIFDPVCYCHLALGFKSVKQPEGFELLNGLAVLESGLESILTCNSVNCIRSVMEYHLGYS